MTDPALTVYVPEPIGFRHNPHGIHGIAHAARVLVWVDELARSVAAPGALALEELRWAASCHDVGRLDDGRDPGHPRRSAEWVLANFDRVRPDAASDLDLSKLAELCRWHTAHDRSTPVVTLELLILKDADALDRARLGDLDPSHLRLARSLGLVALAQRLFDQTGDGPQASGSAVLAEAAVILGDG